MLGSQTITSTITVQPLLIQGTAPGAQLVMESLSNGKFIDGETPFITPPDLHQLFQVPYTQDNARVHTNSYGAENGAGKYDTSSQEIDDFIFNNPDMVVLFSAGNDARDSQKRGQVDLGQVGTQAFAKNAITTGATESTRPEVQVTYGSHSPEDFPVDPIKSDLVANAGVTGMAAFSSRGFSGSPATARLKPDLVAPGTCILSTKSRNISPLSDIAGVIAASGLGVSTSPDYFFYAGTSMSTPLVAGCCALLREALQKSATNGQSRRQ